MARLPLVAFVPLQLSEAPVVPEAVQLVASIDDQAISVELRRLIDVAARESVGVTSA